jgi:hypothetical protein
MSDELDCKYKHPNNFDLILDFDKWLRTNIKSSYGIYNCAEIWVYLKSKYDITTGLEHEEC